MLAYYAANYDDLSESTVAADDFMNYFPPNHNHYRFCRVHSECVALSKNAANSAHWPECQTRKKKLKI